MKNKKDEIVSSTQIYTEIKEITNNLLVLNNGVFSLIMRVSSLNFALLSEEEQDIIIYGYSAFLNSLNFPIQIVVQSKRKNITKYIQRLKIQETNTDDENKKQLIKEYRNFITELISERNILDKKFFIVVSATPVELGMITPNTFMSNFKYQPYIEFETKKYLTKAKAILEVRRDQIISQLATIDLKVNQLSNQEIIQLFYNNYNPNTELNEVLLDSSFYTTSFVRGDISVKTKKQLYNDHPIVENITKIGQQFNSNTQTNVQTTSLEGTQQEQKEKRPLSLEQPIQQQEPLQDVSTSTITKIESVNTNNYSENFKQDVLNNLQIQQQTNSISEQQTDQNQEILKNLQQTQNTLNNNINQNIIQNDNELEKIEKQTIETPSITVDNFKKAQSVINQETIPTLKTADILKNIQDQTISQLKQDKKNTDQIYSQNLEPIQSTQTVQTNTVKKNIQTNDPNLNTNIQVKNSTQIQTQTTNNNNVLNSKNNNVSINQNTTQTASKPKLNTDSKNSIYKNPLNTNTNQQNNLNDLNNNQNTQVNIKPLPEIFGE